MRLSRTSLSAALLLGLLGLGGCKPNCEQVCTKVLACDDLGTERESEAECEETCNQQKELYANWDDGQLRDKLDDEMTCLDDSTCGDIADGVCYDQDLWSF